MWNKKKHVVSRPCIFVNALSNKVTVCKNRNSDQNMMVVCEARTKNPTSTFLFPFQLVKSTRKMSSMNRFFVDRE